MSDIKLFSTAGETVTELQGTAVALEIVFAPLPIFEMINPLMELGIDRA